MIKSKETENNWKEKYEKEHKLRQDELRKSKTLFYQRRSGTGLQFYQMEFSNY
jgi:hypothetical protein